MEKNITLDVLKMWKSPEDEASIAKNIPIWLLPYFAPQNVGKYVYRYRGPSSASYDRPQSHTIRQYAESFAIYPRYNDL
jgi:hypothetical protein